MAIIKKMRGFKYGMIFAALLSIVAGLQFPEAAEIIDANVNAAVFPLRILDSIPQLGAGIKNFSRVHDDTSFAVLIESEHGIDPANPDSIRLLISDGEFEVYERNLKSSAVRVVEVDNAKSPATLLWAVYDRSLEPIIPPFYPLDAAVQIFLEVEDIYGNEIPAADGQFQFKIESDRQQAHAFDHLPESVTFRTGNSNDGYDRGVEVVSGSFTGARILYKADEPILPAFGPMGEIELLLSPGGRAVGSPLNLMPHTVFNHPVKLFIPFPETTDVSNLDLYYYNGVQWLTACNTDGSILPGGKGWMVPGSRVNHPAQSPPQIEIEVYHFSAAQAVVAESSSSSSNTQHRKSGSGAVVYVSCFIDSAAAEGEIGISLLCFLGWLCLLSIVSREAIKLRR